MFRRARVHPFWRRFQDRPFAAALAILLIVSPILTATGHSLQTDILKSLVPDAVFWAILFTYFMGGVFLFFGMGMNRLNFEAAGCALALSGLVIRFIALVYVMGPTLPVVATGLFYIIFGGACVERFVQCVKGDHIIRVGKTVDLDFDVEVQLDAGTE